MKRSEARKSPDRSEWTRGGAGRVWKIRVPRPEFSSSSSAETPMSCEQRWKTAGEDSGGKFPRVLSPNSRPHRPRRPMEGRGRRFPQSGNRLPRANSAPKRTTEGADLRRGPPSEGLPLRLLAMPPDRRSRRWAGPDGPRFSIGRRSLGSAPIENPKASSDSGGRPPSLGPVERSEGRAPSERRAELGGGRGAANNRP